MDENVNNTKKKWSWWPFEWHFWPEPKPLKIESFYEISILTILLIVFIYIYVRANHVNVVTLDIGIACIDRNNKNADTCGIVSQTGYVYLKIPMTDNAEELGKNPSDVNKLSLYVAKKTEKNDSANKEVLEDRISDVEKKTYFSFDSLSVNKLKNRYDSICNKYSLDTITPVYHYSERIKVRKDFVSKLFPVHLQFVGDSLPDKTESGLSINNLVLRLMYDKKKSAVCNDVLSQYQSCDFSTQGTARTLGYAGWFALEDISQQYYHININSYQIDTLILSVDFLGATEFSKMHPFPDSINMSSIIFNDQNKIKLIKRNGGLRFHAKFKELEHKQSIRLFFLTTIIGGIFITLLIFVIFAFYITILSNSTRKKWLFRILFLLAIWSLWYWFFYYNQDVVDQRTGIVLDKKLYVVSLFVVTLLSFDIVGVGYLRFAWKTIRYLMYNLLKWSYLRPSLMILSGLSFIMVLMGSMNVINDIDKMVERGNYERAVNLMCDKILSKEVVSSEDSAMFTKILINSVAYSDSPIDTLLDSVSSAKFVNELLYYIRKDSVFVFDIQNRKKTFSGFVPNCKGLSIEGDVLYTTDYAGHIYFKQIDKKNKWFKVNASSFVLSKDSRFLFTRQDSTFIAYDLCQGPKLISKKIIKGGFLNWRLSDDTKYLSLLFKNRITLLFRFPSFELIRAYKNKGVCGFYNNFLIMRDNRYNKAISDSLYIYDIEKGCHSFIKVKGHLAKIVNSDFFQLITQKDNTIYFYSLKQPYLSNDSIEFHFDGVVEDSCYKHLNTQLFNMLKSIADKHNHLRCIWNNMVLIYNDSSHIVSAYDVNYPSFQIMSTKGNYTKSICNENTPCFYVENVSGDSITVYNGKNFVNKLNIQGHTSIKDNYILFNHQYALQVRYLLFPGKIFETTKPFCTSYSSFSDEFKEFENGIVVFFDYNKNCLLFARDTSTEGLIKNNQYLSNCKKKKLIENIRKNKRSSKNN